MRLIHFSNITEEQYNEYIDEWEKAKETIVPQVSGRRGLTYSQLQNQWSMQEISPVLPQKHVRATLFFLINESNQILGSIHLRYRLTDVQINAGLSHVGAGIKPSERNKGYGTLMLRLLLDSLNKDEVDSKIIVTVRESNVFSIKTIEKNGGIMEGAFVEDGYKSRRYSVVI